MFNHFGDGENVDRFLCPLLLRDVKVDEELHDAAPDYREEDDGPENDLHTWWRRCYRGRGLFVTQVHELSEMKQFI